MKLTFFGAAKAVTGSCHCVEVAGKKILVDCGLQQGRDERDNAVLDFAPNDIDYVIITHAHIDHSGRVPLLVKHGFKGQIFTTRLTGGSQQTRCVTQQVASDLWRRERSAFFPRTHLHRKVLVTQSCPPL